MDTKQLITGSPKEGFYPIVQDTVTVIELNKAVLSLTSESSSEDIIAAFDSVEDFTTLLQNVRNTENIVNGILANDSILVGKIFCNIIAHNTQETLYIDGVFTNQYFNIIITNTDGIFSCVKNVVSLNREVGDKTNVLILSLENDLANGQKDSPVTAEVSAALKDAISTGKACVIKSANSDILANLQQTGDNVTIIMEQISRVGQTFVAVNTTITVNTATNVISDYQTGAIVLETEGDGSKFLSNDGSYKEINSSVVIPVNLKLNEIFNSGGPDGYDFSQIYNAYISGKTVYLKDSSDNLYLVINASNNDVIYYARNTTGTYSGKPTLYQFGNTNYGGAVGTAYVIRIINDPDNILFKDNTMLYTPTADYEPATKKYVDDSKEIAIYDTIDALNADKENLETKIVNGEIKAVMIKEITFENNTYIAYTIFLVSSVISGGMVITLTSSAIINILDVIKQYQLTSSYHADYVLSEIDYYTKLNILHKDDDEDKITGNFTDINNLINWNKVVIADDIYSLDYTYPLRYSYSDPSGTSTLIGWDIIKGNLLKLDFKVSDKSCTQTKYKMPRYEVVTESEYSALGETPNTDNVLYFVTPD